jgi:hypothetical protein
MCACGLPTGSGLARLPVDKAGTIGRIAGSRICAMPAPGGAADKFGNSYESLWAIDQLLQIIDDKAVNLTLEPLDAAESQGIEFSVTADSGMVEYWCVKRQTTAASGWTLPRLTRKDTRGRSILGDLFGHTERASENCGVFASTLGAADLEELRTYASTLNSRRLVSLAFFLIQSLAWLSKSILVGSAISTAYCNDLG